MMNLLGPFALRSAPFSRTRFIGYMAVLAAIAALSIASEQRAPSRVVGAPAGSGEATIVRFNQPADYTSGDLRQTGIPWFLRQQGATAEVEIRGDRDLDIAVSVQGGPVGTYGEHLVALGDDRSKVLVTFVPVDMSLVGALAAPIKTKLDPATLMRVVMAEHIRSSINGGGFDMNVLTDTPGSRWSVFRKAFADSGRCANPQTDDFPSCPDEDKDANIRRAYREEAARGGER